MPASPDEPPQPQSLGVAAALEEPHRPKKRDLFIEYPWTYEPSHNHPAQWPRMFPISKRFADSHPQARFALLRIWSAPHFWPIKAGPDLRSKTRFIDSANRLWEWKVVPKDAFNGQALMSDLVRKILEPVEPFLGVKLVSWSSLVLVMAQDENELLRHCTAVTFRIQALRPWLLEIDLWKSFVNVDLEFLEGLEPHWLE